MLPQTARQQDAEATAFFIILVIAILILYVYYGWYVPIMDLKDKNKSKFKPIITLLIAIIPLVLIAWAIIDEFKRVSGLEAQPPATPLEPAGTVLGAPPPEVLAQLKAPPPAGGVTYKTAV